MKIIFQLFKVLSTLSDSIKNLLLLRFPTVGNLKNEKIIE